jgi:hypothetical protein
LKGHEKQQLIMKQTMLYNSGDKRKNKRTGGIIDSKTKNDWTNFFQGSLS